MPLFRLRPGCRWQAIEAPEITGTVVRIGEGSAVVDLDGEPYVDQFEARGKIVRILRSGSKRTTITRRLEVRQISSPPIAQPAQVERVQPQALAVRRQATLFS
jgi:hypothetical protein